MNNESSHPLRIPMDDIFRRLTILNGFINLLSHQLEAFQKYFKQIYDEHGVDYSNVFADFALIIPDLTTTDDHHIINNLHAGAFIRQGDEYIKAGEEFVSNWSSWTIAQCYEAFETYLRDLASYYYFMNKPIKPIGSLRQIPIEFESITAWKTFFRERQWDPFSIMKLLRSSNPTIEEYEKKNKYNIDLQQWHLLFASVRHAVTHSNSRLHRDELKASSESIENLLPKIFPGVWEDDTYIIRVTESNAEVIIQLTGAYAYLIYKKLCIGLNLNPLMNLIV